MATDLEWSDGINGFQVADIVAVRVVISGFHPAGDCIQRGKENRDN
jgi:hypothetical protein